MWKVFEEEHNWMYCM